MSARSILDRVRPVRASLFTASDEGKRDDGRQRFMALVQPHGPAGSGTFFTSARPAEPYFAPVTAKFLLQLRSQMARLGRAPRRQDLDPCTFGQAITRLLLLDPATTDQPSRVRLAGGVICDTLGVEPRGKSLEEVLTPGSAQDLLGLTDDHPQDCPIGVWAGSLTRYDGAPMAAGGLILTLPPEGGS